VRRLAASIATVALAWALCWGRAGIGPDAAGDPGSAGQFLVLEGATLIDGTGDPPRRDAVVTVRGDRILSVRRSLPRGAGAAGAGPARVVDLKGRWLLPGFIDMHAHVTILPMGADGLFQSHSDRAASEQVLRTLLAMGITTVRNPAAPSGDGVALREAVAAGSIQGPRIFTAGESMNLPAARLSPPAVGVETEEQVRAEVRRQAGAGVDFVKLYASLPPPLVRAAIEEAHAHGLRVIGHLQETTWTEAARAGIDFITHGAPWAAAYLPAERRSEYRALGAAVRSRINWLEWLDPRGPEIREMIRLLKERRIPLDPTLIAYHTKFWGDDRRYLNSPDLALVPGPIRATWDRGWLGWGPREFARARAVWPKVLELVRLYYDRGVTLLAGSDVPNPWIVPGVGFHQEMELLVSAGIPPRAVLVIATANGARALGIGEEAGTIEAGKLADMVVLSADPLASISNTRSIEWVVKGGVMLRPADLMRW
jgi:imidazolonepropionase-like amidohydrolase